MRLHALCLRDFARREQTIIEFSADLWRRQDQRWLCETLEVTRHETVCCKRENARKNVGRVENRFRRAVGLAYP